MRLYNYDVIQTILMIRDLSNTLFYYHRDAKMSSVRYYLILVPSQVFKLWLIKSSKYISI